jgi:hypothetical protein
MHDVPELVLAVWKLWLTADQICKALFIGFTNIYRLAEVICYFT